MNIRVAFLGHLPSHLEKRVERHGPEMHIDLSMDANSTIGQLKESLSLGPGWLATVGGKAVLDGESLRDKGNVTFFAPMEGG